MAEAGGDYRGISELLGVLDVGALDLVLRLFAGKVSRLAIGKLLAARRRDA